MAIRTDSYSSTAEVKAFTRHLLDGQPAFSESTRPRASELEEFINKASGVLNVAIAAAGFAPSAIHSNTTAKLSCDDWVTNYSVRYVELTQRGTGYSEQDGSRTASFNMQKSAQDFVKINSLGFINLGISQSVKRSALAVYRHDETKPRADRTDTIKEQPYSERHKFNNPQIFGDE